MSVNEQSKLEHFNSLAEDEHLMSDPTSSGNLSDKACSDEHLAPEEIYNLLNGTLIGERLVVALVHLENCSECQKKIPPVKVERLLRSVFGEEEVIVNSDCTPENNSINKTNLP